MIIEKVIQKVYDTLKDEYTEESLMHFADVFSDMTEEQVIELLSIIYFETLILDLLINKKLPDEKDPEVPELWS